MNTLPKALLVSALAIVAGVILIINLSNILMGK